MDTINTLQKKLMITETQQGKTADDSVEKLDKCQFLM